MHRWMDDGYVDGWIMDRWMDDGYVDGWMDG